MTYKNEENIYEEAKKRVNEEKKFYSHLFVYVVINIGILIMKLFILPYNLNRVSNVDKLETWQYWDLLGTPILWGIGLVIHGVWTFRRKLFSEKFSRNSIFSKEWEEQKIKEFMKDDNF